MRFVYTRLLAVAIAGGLLLACGGKHNNAPLPIPSVKPTFEITNAGNLPPAIQNVPYAFGLQTNVGGTGVPASGNVSFQLASNSTMPPGMALDPLGIVRGTPTQAGVYDFNVIGVDSANPPHTTITTTVVFDVRLPGVTLTQVGQNSLGGQGQNGGIFVHGSHAFIGTRGTLGSCPATGVKIVDLSQPTSPTLLTTVGGQAQTAQEEVKVQTSVVGTQTIDLMAVAVQPCPQFPTAEGGVELWDLTNPGSPTQLGMWKAGFDTSGNGLRVRDVAIVPFVDASGAHHTYILAALPNSVTLDAMKRGDLRVIDATNPAQPTEIGSWDIVSALKLNLTNTVKGQDQRVFLDSISLSDDQQNAFLAYWDAGVVILHLFGSNGAPSSGTFTPTDVPNLNPDGSANSNYNPAVVLSQTVYPTLTPANLSAKPPVYSSPEGNTHRAAPVLQTQAMLVADEVCASQKMPDPNNPGNLIPAFPANTNANQAVCGFDVDLTPSAGWGFVRTYSLASLSSPSSEGFVVTPESESNPAPDNGIYTAHEIAWNGDMTNPHGYVAWFSDGVVDISLGSLTSPAILSAFVPPAAPDPQASSSTDPAHVNPTKPLVYGVAAYAPSGGNRYIVASDINSGLWVIQESAAPAFIILNASVPAATVNVPYSFQFQSANGTPSISWSVSSGQLPGGLQLDSSTGVLKGIPTATGNFTFTVRATDSAGNTAEQPITLTVNNNFTIIPGTLPTGTLNEPYTLTLAAANGTGTVQWSVSSGSLPPGLTLGTSGKISGTPTTNGTFNFTVSATDSASPPHQASQAFSITVEPLTFATPATLPGAGVGQAYSTALKTANGTPPFKFTVPASELPPGITLNSSGVLSGTPTSTGTFSLDVTVTDNAGQTATQTFTLVIASFSVSTTTLPSGRVGFGYLQQIQVSNGTSPFTFTLTSGTLPSGLKLTSDGKLEGVPAANSQGTYQFTVQVTDKSGRTATQAYTLVINP